MVSKKHVKSFAIFIQLCTYNIKSIEKGAAKVACLYFIFFNVKYKVRTH